MPGTPLDEAVRTLNRLRLIVTGLDWAAISGNMSLTLSAGVCALCRDASADDILAQADAALYRAKDAGRNCVMAAGVEVKSASTSALERPILSIDGT